MRRKELKRKEEGRGLGCPGLAGVELFVDGNWGTAMEKSGGLVALRRSGWGETEEGRRGLLIAWRWSKRSKESPAFITAA